MDSTFRPAERRTTLLDRCSRAATAAEARFRVDYPNARPRVSRVVALDVAGAAILRRLGGAGARGAAPFITISPAAATEELAGADLVVMVAGSDQAAPAGSVIGDVCAARGIMTAAIVVGAPGAVEAAVSALRPHAAVLVVTGDEDYVQEMLSALRG